MLQKATAPGELLPPEQREAPRNNRLHSCVLASLGAPQGHRRDLNGGLRAMLNVVHGGATYR